MIGGLLLLSSLLVLSVALLQTFVMLQNWKKHQHHCRLASLKAQEHILKGFEELMSLNPEARLLRQQRKLAERKVKMALTPKTRALAQAHLMAVILRQTLFARKQRQIIQHSRLKATHELHQNQLQLKQPKVPFALLKHPPLSLTPDYILPPVGLEHLQKIEVTWKHKYKNFLLKNQCGSTISRKLQGLKIKLLFLEAFS